jgi:DNA-directed RNA polymerase omega subunit
MKELPENISSKYLFVTVAAQRCAQLLAGAKPKIDAKEMEKSTTVAMNEVVDGLIEFKRKEEIQEEEQQQEAAEAEVDESTPEES